jgi:hypothetical protein
VIGSRSLVATSAFLVLAFGGSGCDSPETKRCLAAYESAQARVLKVDPKSKASVGESLAAVESALAGCRTANRHTEVDQLIKAKNELAAQSELLERRARRKRAKVPTPEELRRLEREGDPSCPRGQAYRVEGSKDIRCTGPVLVEMTLPQAKAHFEELDYKIRTPAPTTLAVEHGAERYDFTYSRAEGPPSCVVLTPAPGLPWQEAVARATGANPGRLKNPGSLNTTRGPLVFTVDEAKVIIRLGECPPPN